MLSKIKPTWNYLKCLFLSESNWFKKATYCVISIV